MKHTLLSATIALTTLTAAAAHAGGAVGVTITPKNAEQAQVMKIGLGLYALHKGIESNGRISQNGNGNAAGLRQGGDGNLGIIEQDGDDHSAMLSQSGSGNACGIFQYGEGTSADVDQPGNGDACLVLQAGWN